MKSSPQRLSWALIITSFLCLATANGARAENAQPESPVKAEMDSEIGSLDDSDAGMMAQAEDLQMNAVSVKPGSKPGATAPGVGGPAGTGAPGVGEDANDQELQSSPAPGGAPTSVSKSEGMSVKTWRYNSKPAANFDVQLLQPPHRATFSDDGYITFQWKVPAEDAAQKAEAASKKKHKKKHKKPQYKLVLQTLDGKVKLERKTHAYQRLMVLNPGTYKWRIESDDPHYESRWRLIKVMTLKSKSITSLYDGPRKRGPSSTEGGTKSPSMDEVSEEDLNGTVSEPPVTPEQIAHQPQQNQQQPVPAADIPPPSAGTTSMTVSAPANVPQNVPQNPAAARKTPVAMKPTKVAPVPQNAANWNQIQQNVRRPSSTAPTTVTVRPKTRLDLVLEKGLED